MSLIMLSPQRCKGREEKPGFRSKIIISRHGPSWKGMYRFCKSLASFAPLRWKIGMKQAVCLLALLAWLLPAQAEGLLMVRSKQSFPEAMLTLQGSIEAAGYTLSRVQRVDIGLTASGFATDMYRVVFLGKIGEVRELTEQYPELIPYLPLKIAVFAEGNETLLVTYDPVEFSRMYQDPALQPYFMRWARDLQNILEVVRETE
jgi:uncharacterized protein (DUF302 family)